MKIPRILITAPSSGGGKTMLTCGILQALLNRGYYPAAFKCGPDYIDPMFHKRVLGVDSYNLDTFLCGKDGVKNVLKQHGNQSDIAVMEGVMGYYDGLAGISTDASAYDVADVTETPAILLVDCKGLSVSVLPVIEGFLGYKKNSRIGGVILNRLSPMMYGRMKKMIEEQMSITVFGYLPVMKDVTFESRYLGLKLPNEVEKIKEQIQSLGKQVEKSIDLEGLIKLAESAPEVKVDVSLKNETDGDCLDSYSAGRKNPDLAYEKIKIGIAQDEAFCFIYRDNKELLERMGAELVPFSPLRDEKLPKNISGILLYGGYPELYAEKLSANQAMRVEIKQKLEKGLPCMAECGGFMYLMEEMEGSDGKNYPMVGSIKGASYQTHSLKRFGYITLSGGTVFEKNVGDIPAHEFHYYDAEECGHAFTAKKPLSERHWKCMISTETLFAGYPHLYYQGNPKIAEAFLEACKKEKNKGGITEDHK